MEQVCERANLVFKFFNGIRPNFPKSIVCDHSPVLGGRFLNELSVENSPGTFGCSLSHALLWENIRKNNHENSGVFLVMEDDVSLSPNFRVQLSQVLAELPHEFDFCFLGGWPSDPRFRLSQPRHSSALLRMKHFCLTSTAIYLINSMRIQSLQHTLLPFLDEIDVHIAENREKIQIFLYGGASPCCLTQVRLGSERIQIDSAAK